MTMDQLDTLRLAGIFAALAAIVAVAMAIRFIPKRERRSAALAQGAANLVGGLASLMVSGLYLFVDGWGEYFARDPGRFEVDYRSPFRHAGRVVSYVSRLDPVILGLACGLLGLVFLFAATRNFRTLRPRR